MRPLLLAFLFLFSASLTAQAEADYIRALGEYLNGQTEFKVMNGRVDILTNTYAIEVERAPKWKNSIGQSLWYGQQTLKKPGIILLIETPAQRKYGLQLQSTIDHFGLTNQIKVWLYPDDFPELKVTSPTPALNTDPTLTHWLNLNSNKRHASDCASFGTTANGRYCTAYEGEAAGCCH